MKLLEKAIWGSRPLIVVAILAASGAMIATYHLLVFWLAVPVALGLIASLPHGKKALWSILVPVLFWGYALWRMPCPAPNDLSKLTAHRACIFQAQVVSILSSNKVTQYQRVIVAPYRLLFPERKTLSGKCVLTVYGQASIETGQRLEVRAQLEIPAHPAFPWQFDYKEHLAQRGIFSLAVARASYVRQLVQEERQIGQDKNAFQSTIAWICQLIENTRAQIIASHRKCAGGAIGDLLSSMVLGDRAVDLSNSITTSFRDVGLSHVLAASGFNLTIVIGVTWFLARLVLRSNVGINLFCFVSMALFVCLAGPSPSVLRAALMCTLLLLSRCVFRTFDVGVALSFALLVMLLIEPGSIADIGLQFSYAATVGIVCGAKPLAALLMRNGSSRIVKWFVETAAVVLVAQFSVLGLQLQYFWRLSLLFLPANLLVAPVVPCITALGFVSSAAIVIDPSCVFVGCIVHGLDWASSWLLKFMLFVVENLASLQDCKLVLGPPSLWCLLFYYLFLAGLFFALNLKRYRAWAALLFFLSVVLLLWRPPMPVTVGCFPHQLVIVNPNRKALSVGGTESSRSRRFISFFGARLSNVADSYYKVVHLEEFDMIELPQLHGCIIIVHDNFKSGTLPRITQQCLLVVKEGARFKRDGAIYNRLLEMVRTYKPSWLVVAGEKQGRLRFKNNALENVLEVGDTKLVSMGKEEVVLVLDGSKSPTGKLRLWQASH